MVIDAELIKSNCFTYSKLHPKAIQTLKLANGKLDYKQIASILKIHEKTVSPLLKEAYKLGLATKDSKFYKKVPGVLKYMPKITKQKSLKKLVEQVKKARKKKFKFPKTKNQEEFRINFKNKIEKMAKSYMWLYMTENSLRELIRKVLDNDKDWWVAKVNSAIRSDVEKQMEIYPYHAASRQDELEYTHLGQLKEIIIAKNNWQNFQPYLAETNKNNFMVIVDRAIPSRNCIGHCIPLNSEDSKVVEVRFQDILKMIK